jgi:hypothetical protein
MNRLFILGLWAVLLQPFAGASTLQTFTNDSFTTTLVNVPQSVVHIVNRGRIADQGVLETYDTLTFTNVAGLSGPQHSGVIQMTGGFWFNHNPSTGSFRRWADSFFNDNNALIQVVDGTRAAILPRALH